MLALPLALAALSSPPPQPSRAAPLAPPAAALEQLPPVQLAGPTPATLFVNFDGAVLNDTREDSRTNGTLIGWSGTFKAYGDGTKRAAVMQAVRQDWQPFAAEVTDARPTSGDYAMVMVGPTNFTDGSLGIALLDCGNAWTPNNVVYAFHHIDDAFTAAATATTISQEIAHSYGLEHVDDEGDIMYPYNTGGDPLFTDSCHTVLEAPGIGILCTEQHQASCGRSDQQNGRAELMRFLGPRPVDVHPPTIGFVEPEDDTTFDLGDPFVLEVDADDDTDVVAVELWSGDQLVAADDARPYSWEVTGAPAGTYVFEARAYDAAGNEAVTEVLTLHVAGDAYGDTDGETDGDTEGDEPSFGSTGDDGDDPPPDAALGPQKIPDEEDPYDPFVGQCDCRTDAPTPSPAALLGLVLLVGLARRRPR